MGGHFVAFAHIGVGTRQQGADRLLQIGLRLGDDHAEPGERLVDPGQHAVAGLHGVGALSAAQ